MEWTKSISAAINYIEENITEELTIEEIAKQAMISSFYFQKGFSMLCGFTVGEYIKKRRLTLAGSEIASTNRKIIDIALKYGYDSPDSFTKAFTRFHGAAPTSVRKGKAMIKSFASLQVKLSLEGGYTMDYKITKKEEFSLVGVSKILKYEEAVKGIPSLWAEYYQTGKNEIVCGTYGVSFDENLGGNEFEYIIADVFNPESKIEDGFITRIIPKHTWAIFACYGAMPHSMQEFHKKIFSKWLPDCRDYEIAAGYHIEMYNNPELYEKGLKDKTYYSEIWIPVNRIS